MDGNNLFLATDKEAMNQREREINLKTTVLHRAGGFWLSDEINKLKRYLGGAVFQGEVLVYRSTHPSFLVLLGHIQEHEIKRAIGMCAGFTVREVTGTGPMSNLPFPLDPSFGLHLRQTS